MVTGSEKTDKLLVYSPKAGSVTDEVQRRLHEEFADFTFVEFPPAADWLAMLEPKSTVVACGGRRTHVRPLRPSGAPTVDDLGESRPSAGAVKDVIR